MFSQDYGYSMQPQSQGQQGQYQYVQQQQYQMPQMNYQMQQQHHQSQPPRPKVDKPIKGTTVLYNFQISRISQFIKEWPCQKSQVLVNF